MGRSNRQRQNNAADLHALMLCPRSRKYGSVAQAGQRNPFPYRTPCTTPSITAATRVGSSREQANRHDSVTVLPRRQDTAFAPACSVSVVSAGCLFDLIGASRPTSRRPPDTIGKRFFRSFPAPYFDDTAYRLAHRLQGRGFRSSLCNVT